MTVLRRAVLTPGIRDFQKGRSALAAVGRIAWGGSKDANGSIIVPAAAELGPLPGDDDGVTTVDRFVSFVVDAIPSGDFTLRLALDALFVSEDGITEATFDFSL